MSAVLTSIPAPVINEVLATTAEFGTGVINSFLIENLKIGWTPKAYFDGLRRLRRRSGNPVALRTRSNGESRENQMLCHRHRLVLRRLPHKPHSGKPF